MKYLSFIILIVTFFNPGSLLQGTIDSWPILRDPYMGQKAPSDQARIFMDGIICTASEPEMCAAFTVNGKEFYYNRLHKGKWTIFFTREINGKWIVPVPMPFCPLSEYTTLAFENSSVSTLTLMGRCRKTS